MEIQYNIGMKEINNKFYYDADDVQDLEMVEVAMMDDSDWEYLRVGIGEMGGKVFVVDLDDSGEMLREMKFVKEGLSVDDVLKIGCEVGVFVEIDWGYDEDDKFRVSWEGEGDWDEFNKRVGIEGVEY